MQKEIVRVVAALALAIMLTGCGGYIGAGGGIGAPVGAPPHGTVDRAKGEAQQIVQPVKPAPDMRCDTRFAEGVEAREGTSGYSPYYGGYGSGTTASRWVSGSKTCHGQFFVEPPRGPDDGREEFLEQLEELLRAPNSIFSKEVPTS